jgi:RHS repeat-associated protein
MGSDVHLRHLPTAVTVYDSGGSVVAKTTYGYDQTSVTPTGAGQHDASLTDHGNLTTESVYKDAGTSLDTHRTYDDLGNVLTVTDPRGYATQYAYGSACSYAFPTQVTNALDQHAHIQYDCNIGKPSSITGLNEEVTTFSYSDALDRLTSVSEPENRQSSHSYSMNPPYVVSTTAGVETRVEFDGLGRQTASILYNGGTVASRTDTQYDALGRVWKVSNPYDTGSPVWTTTTYDALSRATRVTHPDSSFIQNTYAGNEATVQDESGKKRRNITDALGRLVEVREDPDGSNYGTTYAYDTIDNLTGVSQGGQPRSFAYDWAKRLTSATNPESNYVSYAYDNSGNVTTRTRKTFAGGSVIDTVTSTYDSLDRLTSKSYSDGTPTVTYTYDTVKNGRLSSVSNSVSTTSYTAYDALGRVTAGNQNTTGGATYPFSYTYNALGLTSMTYPSGRTVSYDYDFAGRVSAIGGTKDSQALHYTQAGSSIGYATHGALETLTLGNGLTESWDYDDYRLRPSSMSVGSLLTLGFGYFSNGNMQSQTISVPGASAATQSFTYDGVNRLSTANEGSEWSRSFGYDAYGNMWVSAASGVPAASFTPQAASWFVDPNDPNNPKNRLVNAGLSIQYDGGGSLSQIGGYAFTYDAEGRLKTSTMNSVTTTYDYDGEGRRVRKTKDGATTVYVYDAMGKLAAEYGGTADGGGTQYLTADHLGSTRLVTDAGGSVVKRHDYLPFGEEIPSDVGFRTAALGYGSDSFPLKFTGKERDAETGLDYFGARYFSGAQGRFTSPDPGPYKLEDPRTFNRYAYVNNNSLKYVDPTGREAEYVIDEENKTIRIRASITIWGPQATQAYAARVKAQMESAWKGSYKDPKTGAVYSVSTVAEVSVYDPLVGVGVSARNGFYVSNDVRRDSFEYRNVDPRWPARFPGDPGIYTGALNPTGDAERHEGGHVLGQPEDYYRAAGGTSVPKAGHAGHLMADWRAKTAAQDEIDRIGSYTLNQMRTTHKNGGTIVVLPEPPRPK